MNYWARRIRSYVGQSVSLLEAAIVPILALRVGGRHMREMEWVFSHCKFKYWQWAHWSDNWFHKYTQQWIYDNLLINHQHGIISAETQYGIKFEILDHCII